MPKNTAEYQKAYRQRQQKSRKVLSVSVPIDDFVEIERYAKGQGFSVSRLMREATLHQARSSQMQSQAVAEELRELRFLVSNIANNVNQMAYHSNQVRDVADANGLWQELKKLDDTIQDFTQSRLKQKP